MWGEGDKDESGCVDFNVLMGEVLQIAEFTGLR